MPDTKKLTPRQRKILDWIVAQPAPPSVRELCLAFGVSSPNGMMCHLNALELKGMIVRNRKVARGIRIVGQHDELLQLLHDVLLALPASPLAGRVSAEISRLENRRA